MSFKAAAKRPPLFSSAECTRAELCNSSTLMKRIDVLATDLFLHVCLLEDALLKVRLQLVEPSFGDRLLGQVLMHRVLFLRQAGQQKTGLRSRSVAPSEEPLCL